MISTLNGDRQAGEVERLVRAVLRPDARDRAAVLAAAASVDHRAGDYALDVLLDAFEEWGQLRRLPADPLLQVVLLGLDEELHGATAPRPKPVRREAVP